MSGFIFQSLIPVSPISSNSRGGKTRHRFKKKVKTHLDRQQITKSSSNNLHGRIFYFNHEKQNIKDIHNIIKPLFDELEGYVYEDDKQVLYFEGIRLDMEHNTRWFDIELDLSAVPNLTQALVETCCLVEISDLPAATTASAVKVTWL